jgi:hypothetical protein
MVLVVVSKIVIKDLNNSSYLLDVSEKEQSKISGGGGIEPPETNIAPQGPPVGPGG